MGEMPSYTNVQFCNLCNPCIFFYFFCQKICKRQGLHSIFAPDFLERVNETLPRQSREDIEIIWYRDNIFLIKILYISKIYCNFAPQNCQVS